MNKQIRAKIISALKSIPDFGDRVYSLSGVKRDAKGGAFAEVSSGPTQYTPLGQGYEKRFSVLIQSVFPATTNSVQDGADDLIEKIVNTIGEDPTLDGLVDDLIIKSTDSAVSNDSAKAIGYCEIELEVIYEN